MADRLDPAVADAPRQHLVDAAAPAMRKLLERVACGEWGAGEAVDILLDWPNRAGDRPSWGSEFVTALAGQAGARSDPGRSIRGDALAVRDAQLAEARRERDEERAHRIAVLDANASLIDAVEKATAARDEALGEVAHLREVAEHGQTLAVEAGSLREEVEHLRGQRDSARALLRGMARRASDLRRACVLAMTALDDNLRVRDDLMTAWGSDSRASAAVRLAWPAGARILDDVFDVYLEDNPPGDIADVPPGEAEDTSAARIDWPDDVALRDLARWLVAMDDPEDVQGREARRTVTLSAVIDRARAALGDAGDPPVPDARPCRSCGRPFSPTHDASAPGPTSRHPYFPVPPRPVGGAGDQTAAEHSAWLDVVLDGPPGPEPGRFVEVEDEHGRSVNVGEWIDRGDGYWALRIARPPVGGAGDTAPDDPTPAEAVEDLRVRVALGLITERQARESAHARGWEVDAPMANAFLRAELRHRSREYGRASAEIGRLRDHLAATRADRAALADELSRMSGGWRARVTSRRRLQDERDAALAARTATPSLDDYAIIHVRSGDHGEAWPIVERVPGGWQSGAHHYPDSDVRDVMRLCLVPPAGVDIVTEAAQVLQETFQESPLRSSWIFAELAAALAEAGLLARTATPPPAEPDGRIVALRAMCTEAEETAAAATAEDLVARRTYLTTAEIRSVIDDEEAPDAG